MPKSRTIQRLLIANRGEIACRIIQTARQFGITTIAIYSEVDAQARHVQFANEAYPLGGCTAQASYLNQAKILTIAQANAVDAIHPGYGFLSENPIFAKLCEKNQITFVGPPAKIIELMGSKKSAKSCVEAMGLPSIPGFNFDPNQDPRNTAQQCQQIGFPILIKAAAGGGGKGMRIVTQAEALHRAIQQAQQEAHASFNDDSLIIEKYLANPRHIECQVFADQQGNVVHLFERDCSVQRRYQKIVEEAPAPNLTTSVRKQIQASSVQMTQAIGYIGAGTIEYLVHNDCVYFMEMNTRLQVEHPVTEKITGLDLVSWQLKVAQGETLPLSQKEIPCHGHAIEIRLYAEDPYNQFKPQLGTIEALSFPEENRSLRIDHGLKLHDSVTPYYDPMIAKVITYHPTRAQSIAHMQTLLKQIVISPVTTNQAFLHQIFQHEAFLNADHATDFIGRYFETPTSVDLTPTAAVAAFYFYQQISSPFAYFRLNQAKQARIEFELGHTTYCYDICEDLQSQSYYLKKFSPQDQPSASSHLTHPILSEAQLICQIDGYTVHYKLKKLPERVVVFYGACIPIQAKQKQAEIFDNSSERSEQHAIAIMPGTVVRHLVTVNTSVKAGDEIMVIEAMKMQQTLTAAYDGILSKFYFDIGQSISEGDCLYQLDRYNNNTQDSIECSKAVSNYGGHK